jgi:hypothetical protein
MTVEVQDQAAWVHSLGRHVDIVDGEMFIEQETKRVKPNELCYYYYYRRDCFSRHTAAELGQRWLRSWTFLTIFSRQNLYTGLNLLAVPNVHCTVYIILATIVEQPWRSRTFLLPEHCVIAILPLW